MRRLVLALALAVLASALSPPPSAGAAAERGAAGPIGYEALLDALKRRDRGGPHVSGHVIRGDDIIAILRRDGVPIELDTCVIEGGLVFRDVVRVAVPITLRNCEIRAAPISRALWGLSSLYAPGVVFSERLSLQASSLAGFAEFSRAEFGKGADFLATRFAETARFDRVTFRDIASFSRVEFADADFSGATFENRAAFRTAAFLKQAGFEKAQFRSAADFRRAVFHAEPDISAEFTGPAHFKDAEFKKSLDFRRVSLSGAHPVTFEDATFGGEANFLGVTFPATAVFSGAVFHGFTLFPGARFATDVRFLSTIFEDGINFFAVAVDGNATFQSAVFKGENDFSETVFSGDVEFGLTRFDGLTLFVGMRADRRASFRGAAFGDEANFENAVFGRAVDFQGTTFADLLTLTTARLGAYADFRDARVAKLDLNSTFTPTIFDSRFDLRGARITRAHIQDVVFEANVDASDAAFGLPEGSADDGAAVFRFVTFEDDAVFARTRFAGRLAIENTRFEGVADFTDADFTGLAREGTPSFALSYVDFGGLLLTWPQLPPTRYWVQSADDVIRSPIKASAPAGRREPVSRALAELETRFRDAGRLDDANAAYFHRRRAELAEARAGGWDWHRLLLEAEWAGWGIVCGYGTKIWWAVGWSAAVTVAFALVYWASAGVTRVSAPAGNDPDPSFRLRLLDLPGQYTQGPHKPLLGTSRLRRFIDSLRLSSVILLKVGSRDTVVGGRLGPVRMQDVVTAQWLLGFYLLAALTVTLTNTQPLLNRLITGVF